MAMEELLDSVRRIIFKWVNTSSQIVQSVSIGDTSACVRNSSRFSPGDSVMFKNNEVYETGLIVESTENQAGIVNFTTPVLNNWTLSNPSTGATDIFLIKTIYEQFVQGIYIGDPDVISMFPAITVNGVSRHSEWLTLESTKERYEVEIGVFVKESTHENGYRFLMAIADEIQAGLKRNILPLISDYDIVSLTGDITAGDTVIRVNNRDYLTDDRRIIIEDDYESQENWVNYIYTADEDPTETAIKLAGRVCWNFDKDSTSVIIPKRFIFNSWPSDIEYGKIHKGGLLKAATIRWFAEEEEMQWYRREELKLK